MLTVKKRECIDMMIDGETTSAIVERLCVSERTIHNWRNDPVFNTALEEAIANCVKSYAPQALRTLVGLLDAKSESVRHTVARELLEWAGYIEKVTGNHSPIIICDDLEKNK